MCVNPPAFLLESTERDMLSSTGSLYHPKTVTWNVRWPALWRFQFSSLTKEAQNVIIALPDFRLWAPGSNSWLKRERFNFFLFTHFLFSHFHWFLCGSGWSASYLGNLALVIHCCCCLCHRKWSVQIILLLLDGKVFVVKLEWLHRSLSSWVRNVTKWKQCQFCSPSWSLVLLFWSSSVIWKRAQHGLTTALQYLFNHFAQDSLNNISWQSNSYGYLCKVDIHYP